MTKKWCILVLIIIAATSAACKGEGNLTGMVLSGPMGDRFHADVRQWLLTAPRVNPGMLEQHRMRDKERLVDLVPWYGEFSGKYLTAAALSYRMEPTDALKETVDYVVRQLALSQSPEGYLGVWPKDQRLEGKNLGGHKTWDAWSHYHNMLGLYLWHEATGSAEALAVCLKAAEYVRDFYLVRGHAIDEATDGTDTAMGHVFALLHRKTGDPRWLEMAEACIAAFESEGGGDYFRAGLAGKPFFKMNKTRWESLHAIQTLAEMYRITGDEDMKTAFENIWWSVCLFDRHNTGGFSSGESAQGNPYDTRAIETCCTIAWMALSVDMLDLTGDPLVADELELATWNGFLGAQNPSGRSFTYNTPMLGDKKASSHDIVFQAVAGSYELNCCSVNGSRGFGMIGEWGVVATEGAVNLNYYGASRATLALQGGKRLTLAQEGAYPFAGDIRISVSNPDGYDGALRLRIPRWSKRTSVSVNGQAQEGVEAGSYFTLPRVADGDVIEMAFDMSPHFWQGDLELGGKTSVYLGPILLAYDQRFNDAPYTKAPAIDLLDMGLETVDRDDGLFPPALLTVRAKGTDGSDVWLCDFASAGQTGAGYTSWLPSQSPLQPPGFARRSPMWGQTIG